MTIGGVLATFHLGSKHVQLIAPLLYIRRRGILIQVDTVLELSSWPGSPAKVLDILLLGFGVCVSWET